MQLKALLLPVFAAGVLASPPWWHPRPASTAPSATATAGSSSGSSGGSSTGGSSTGGYGASSTCLTDAQASGIATAFSSMLTNPDRQAANATGQIIIADGFNETSDSILSLEHLPLGGTTFSGKQLYLKNVVFAPAIPEVDTLDIIHDCTKIVWYWVAKGLGNAEYEARGINIMYTVNQTQIIDNRVEFNSLAWGADIFNTAYNRSQPL